jgi:hypothetical protein
VVSAGAPYARWLRDDLVFENDASGSHETVGLDGRAPEHGVLYPDQASSFTDQIRHLRDERRIVDGGFVAAETPMRGSPSREGHKNLPSRRAATWPGDDPRTLMPFGPALSLRYPYN